MDLNALSDAARTSQTKLESFTATMDPNNMEDMINLQQQMGQMQMLYGTLSAIVSDIKQTSQGIIQKM